MSNDNNSTRNVVCPSCHGNRVIRHGGYDSHGLQEWTQPCQTCDGQGAISEEQAQAMKGPGCLLAILGMVTGLGGLLSIALVAFSGGTP